MRLVVATVHLVGLGPNDAPTWADEKDPQIARWLRGGQLRDVTPKGAKAPTADAFAAEPVPRETPRKRRRSAAPK
jgi:hypothetical protein